MYHSGLGLGGNETGLRTDISGVPRTPLREQSVLGVFCPQDPFDLTVRRVSHYVRWGLPEDLVRTGQTGRTREGGSPCPESDPTFVGSERLGQTTGPGTRTVWCPWSPLEGDGRVGSWEGPWHRPGGVKRRTERDPHP